MIDLLTLLFFFILGTIFGSFFNVIIDRTARGKSFVKGRSACDKCKRKLEFFELIPLLSYLFLKGKCRTCKSNIPIRVFLVEFCSGILFLCLYIYSQLGDMTMPALFFLFFILFSYWAIFHIDIVHGIIPDFLVAISVLSIIGFMLTTNPALIIGNIISALVVFATFFLLFILTRQKGIGFGDVKFSFSMGLFLGFPLIIVSLYLAFLTGAIVSIILVLWGKKRFHGGSIPFGPFLVGGTVTSFFLGDRIIDTILTHFL